ncbi:MAG TPA: hypothetical protein VGF30_08230 [Bacteroidia bacterium]
MPRIFKTSVLFLFFGTVVFYSCGFPSKKIREHKSIDREGFSVNYPSDWSVDTVEQGYDADTSFMIVNKESTSYVSFFVYNKKIDENKALDNELEARVKPLIPGGKTREFYEWGQYKGKGARVKGKILELFPGNISVFVHAGEKRSFVAIWQMYTDEMFEVGSSLKFIEDSFQLK